MFWLKDLKNLDQLREALNGVGPCNLSISTVGPAITYKRNYGPVEGGGAVGVWTDQVKAFGDLHGLTPKWEACVFRKEKSVLVRHFGAVKGTQIELYFNPAK
jgi:hypothetical protein